MIQLADLHGRRFSYLRLSITEACNFSCTYCLPDGYKACGDTNFLGVDEIARVARAFARLGLQKVRITGGEPSLRKDLSRIIQTVANTAGVKQVAMTTNGCLLDKKLDEWKSAGLTALNISVDSLDTNRFKQITGHNRLPQILSSLDRALTMGFDAVKINAVLLKDENDAELERWFDYLRTRKTSVRFIELMQTGDNQEFFKAHHVSAASLERKLCALGWQLAERAVSAGPAKEYWHPDYAGRIGLIAPYSKDFCVGCNRLRMTARGDLRLCLFGEAGRPLREYLQDDDQIDALMLAIQNAMFFKTEGHQLHQGITGATPHLASLGG